MVAYRESRHKYVTHGDSDSTDRRRHAADQLASAFRRASFDRDGHPVDCKRVVGGDDLVYTVRFATRVGQRTINLITQSGDRFSPDVVVGRTANNCAAMIGFVSDCNDF